MSVHPARKPWWQQATALVTVSAGGVITGLNFAPGTPATLTSPNGLPLHLLALQQSATGMLGAPAADGSTQSGDSVLRPVIVNTARHYLQLAKTRTPAEMEALIWSEVSLDGADHGPSCAAFASLTLALAAQATGQQSWVTGGGSYPWPVHSWADVRVDANPDSLTITSIVQDAQAHTRWHPLGDGYVPQPGDWVLFHEHVEVVTSYTDGVLRTIGANSPPNSSVNAHSYSGPLANDGVEGFVDNGHLPPAPGTHPSASPSATKPAATKPTPAASPSGTTTPTAKPTPASTPSDTTPATTKPAPAATPSKSTPAAGNQAKTSIPNGSSASPKVNAPRGAAIPGLTPIEVPGLQLTAGKPAANAPKAPAAPASVQIPGLVTPGLGTPTSGPATPKSTPSASPKPTSTAHPKPTPTTSSPDPTPTPSHATPTPSQTAPARSTPTNTTPSKPHQRPSARPSSGAPGTSSQQAFINTVAPGAMAAQQRWGVPAAVTIAQAIDESGWGQSGLAANYHNLFGIKGSGPAGSVLMPTQEFENGQWVTIDASFRAYHNDAESIADHAELLATSGYYTRAMADRAIPDAFANDLTGVYATDPNYGANLIGLMKLYNLYQYDTPASTPTHPTTTPASPTPTHAATTPAPSATPRPTSTPTAPAATGKPAPTSSRNSGTRAASTATPPSVRGQASIPGLSPLPSATSYGAPAGRTAPRRRAGQPAPAATGSATGSVTTMAYVRPIRSAPQVAQPRGERLYGQPLAVSVRNAFYTTARTPIGRAEPMYKQIANQAGISWKLLAACDWMQCQAQPHMSPVHGERLGSLNADGTVYTTKSAALGQCAMDLIELAYAVYGIDLTVPRRMSVQALADVFAAFRWGGLLRRHGVSSMEFPYSVEGLTSSHVKMRWPAINEPNAPDKPGTRFKMPFGAVPVVLSLNYRATV